MKSKLNINLDDEHYFECPVCRHMALLKMLIIDFDLETGRLVELRDFIDSLLNGDVYEF